MTIETHIFNGPDFLCARCGTDMTGLEINTADYVKMKRGDRIGVINGLRFTPDSAYLIQQPEFDSNKFCAPQRDSIP